VLRISARVPTAQSHNIRSDCRFIGKDEVGEIKETLLANPALSRAGLSPRFE
jgi:hypothetical protein